MESSKHRSAQEEMLDVRRAAALAGRHPETVRRWVWSGRIPARRQGNRLLMARADVEAMTARSRRTASDLAGWAARADAARRTAASRRSGRSAADLVIEDRAERSQPIEARAGR